MSTRLMGAVAALALALLAGSASAAPPLQLGPASHRQLAVYQGYYDGHKDAYVITDVSSKSQATSLHVNFAPVLAHTKGAPEQYFVTGRAAPGQLAVFASEPSEPSYNPLWDEVFVTWKPGVKPVLLVKDDQITQLAKKGMLTLHDPHIVLNAPITSVGSKVTVT
jgi:hypothetical protein